MLVMAISAQAMGAVMRFSLTDTARVLTDVPRGSKLTSDVLARRGSRKRPDWLFQREMDSIAHPGDGRDYSVYIPDHEDCPVAARTLHGMARVRSGQAPAWPLASNRSVRRGILFGRGSCAAKTSASKS
jgi:hypothetical protein